MTLEAAQDVERPRHHLDHITLACEIAGEHSLLAKPFRASSHVLWLHSALRNKIPLAEQSTSGNLRPQQKAVRRDISPSDGPRRTENARHQGRHGSRRVCALPVTTGGNVGDGDEIAFVEAMKMEIPVTSTTAGRIKAILVKLDDVIAEGQVVAIIEA